MAKITWRPLIVWMSCLVLGLIITSCGGGGGGGDGGGGVTVAVKTGSLSTSLTDSSTDNYQAVYVTVTRVDVHHDDDGSWETVASPNKTYDLLHLVNGVRETLGLATLETGHYTQLRLIIGTVPDAGLNLFSRKHPFANYIVDLNDELHELKTPSGVQTGLKVVNGFDIKENQTTELILDFDALRSVVVAGASGQYLLKPTVKVLKTEDYAIVAGLVTDVPPVTTPPTAATALAGAFVSAQLAALVEAGTVADDAGEYALFLEPKSYNLVATREGYLPECVNVNVAAGAKVITDFSLVKSESPPGTVTGTVTIAVPAGEQWATIDFRQGVDCGSGTTPITVASVNIGDGGSYSVALPAGDYTVVASTFGKTSQTATVAVTSGATTTNDITFVVP